MTTEQGTDPLAILSPASRAIVEQVQANEHLAKTPEFERIGFSTDPGPLGALLFTRACTSLSDEDATARMNLVNPTGLSHGWVLFIEAGNGGPVACQDKPETHRHLMWEC